MDETTSIPEETKAREDETAESYHPLNNKSSEDAERNQDEDAETLDDKTAEPEVTIDSNQVDHNSEKTNGVDPALLQSDEPKSKVIGGTLCYDYSCMFVNNFQIPDSKKKWENSDVKVLSYDKKVDDVYYEIEVN